MADSTWGLVCPFLNDSRDYAAGVEFGLLYARMRQPGADVIEDWVLLDNEEQVTLLANRLGWSVEIKAHRDGWALMLLRKRV